MRDGAAQGTRRSLAVPGSRIQGSVYQAGCSVRAVTAMRGALQKIVQKKGNFLHLIEHGEHGRLTMIWLGWITRGLLSNIWVPLRARDTWGHGGWW